MTSHLIHPRTQGFMDGSLNLYSSLDQSTPILWVTLQTSFKLKMVSLEDYLKKRSSSLIPLVLK